VAADALKWPQDFRSGRRISEVAAGFQPAEKHVQVENLHPLRKLATQARLKTCTHFGSWQRRPG
jgi:CHAD domain-containing protein